VRPLPLPANPLRRFYRGGKRIAQLRGLDDGDDRAPEDWVGSVTTAFGSDRYGLSRMEDGRTLADAIVADPEAFLGPERVRRVREQRHSKYSWTSDDLPADRGTRSGGQG
jgi:mannose-6-phosphate isomerase